MLGIDRSDTFQFDPCSESPHLGNSDADSIQRRVVFTTADHLGRVQERGHEGKVISQGSMDAVQNDPKVIEVYLGE